MKNYAETRFAVISGDSASVLLSALYVGVYCGPGSGSSSTNTHSNDEPGEVTITPYSKLIGVFPMTA